MRVRRLILMFALAVIVCFVGAKQGLAYVQAKYGAPCAKLEGFGGFLQDMNFLAQGTCELKKGTSKCQNSGLCTVNGASGQSSRGKCTDLNGACTCVPF